MCSRIYDKNKYSVLCKSIINGTSQKRNWHSIKILASTWYESLQSRKPLARKVVLKKCCLLAEISISCFRLLATGSGLSRPLVEHCLSLYSVLIIWTEKLVGTLLHARSQEFHHNDMILRNWTVIKLIVPISAAHDVLVIRAHRRGHTHETHKTSRDFTQAQLHSVIMFVFS